MGNRLYLIAAILIIVWVVGFFAFKVGDIIYILLAVALIAIILRISQPKKAI